MKIEYELNENQIRTWTKWTKEIRFLKEAEANGEDIFGSIGGATTWIITPTSIGTVIKCEYFGETIDLTDYEDW